jgi:hypothetical protein
MGLVCFETLVIELPADNSRLDALVAGKMTKINAKDLPKDPRFDYYRFSKRPPQTYSTAKAKKVVEADIEMAASKIQFQLYSGEVDP